MNHEQTIFDHFGKPASLMIEGPHSVTVIVGEGGVLGRSALGGGR